MEHCFDSIPGWFDIADGSTLHRALAHIADGGICVEVGSWLGRSTAFIAVEIINSGKKIALYSVDTWKGSPSEPEHLAAVAECGGDLFPSFWQNISNRGLAEMVQPLAMLSTDAATRFDDQSIDFIFIDGEHTFFSVRSDVASWLPKLKDGGMIAGHDADRAIVLAAVQDVIPASRIMVDKKVWSYRKSQLPGR